MKQLHKRILPKISFSIFISALFIRRNGMITLHPEYSNHEMKHILPVLRF